MKKKLLTLTLIFTLLMSSSAFANYSDNSLWVWTGNIAGPHMRPGYDTKSDVYDIRSIIYADCMGSNTRVRVTKKGSLTTDFISDSSRILTVELWEYDTGNPNDLVSVYKGSFVGRRLSTFDIDERVESGLIDSEGDSKAELYTMSRISRCTTNTDKHEWSEIFSNSFYLYEIGMR